FEEKKEEILKKEEISVNEIKELFKDKEIEIKIEKDIEKSNKDSEYNYWNISIKDKGIGINKEKLKYLTEAGSSYKDKAKIIQMNDMPNWLKPSGNFGIGFQSIFLLKNNQPLLTKFPS
ncbi:ATP-binding protein, partial [Fusobacterium mortiferum]|uniref:ATP-binding protein n=1 Tax=Fusobacterium mortiferum TaxID=850 RepID=UPI00195C2463|nr:ATP-binding protein [Fusobacterium mortiferum]